MRQSNTQHHHFCGNSEDFSTYQGEPGTVGLPGFAGLKVSNTKRKKCSRLLWPTRGLTQWDAEWSLQ